MNELLENFRAKWWVNGYLSCRKFEFNLQTRGYLPSMILDATDLRLLHFLQQDGRISNQELAEKVALSPSACLRRLRLLVTHRLV